MVMYIVHLLQVFSGSLDRKIILWDYVDGVLLHKFELSYPICLMFHCGQDPAGFYGVLQIDADSKSMQHAQLHIIFLTQEYLIIRVI